MTTQTPDAAAVEALLAASSNSGNIPLVTYNWNPATQLANYLAAQAKVAAGVAGSQAEIVAVGDSTTLGFGGSPNDYRPTVSYPNDLAVFLSQDGVSAQSDNFLGQGNNNYTITDSRVALIGGAIWGYPFVAGGPVVVANGVGQGFTFTIPTPQIYDRVTVDYLDSGGGTLNVSADGGPVLATLQVGNSGRMMQQTVDLPAGQHAEVTVTAGTANQTDIEGVSFWNSQTPAVQVFNAGEGGAESVVVGDGVTPGAGEISSSAELGANLALINFGINDILQGNQTAAQTTANIALMVNEFRANGTDPIIIIPQPINDPNYLAEIPTLRADIYQLATTLNVPVIDLSATYGNNATAILASGLLGNDGVHPSATLYADIASGIAKLLTGAATATSPVVTSPVVTPPVVTPPVVVPVVTPPAVNLATSPTVANGATTVLGTATAARNDPLTVAVKSDAAFATGSSITLVNGSLVYSPGTITATKSGADSITYSVTDSTTGAVTSETQTVTLTAPVVPPVVVAPVVTPVVTPATVTLGTGPDTLALHVSEDAYLGDAQFTIAVNGVQIGGTQAATASHAAGASQSFDVMGSFSGQNTVTLNFLNDAYGGTPQTDRNFYETSATIDGTVISGAALTELSQGPMNFTFQGPATTPVVTTPVVTTPVVTTPVVTTPVTSSVVTLGSGPDTLALQVSEDAYLGDAQFTIAVNGVQIGGTQTATASHAAGASQTFDVMGSFSGQNTVTLNFLNDAYGGTPQTDRNFYETSATVDGTVISGAALTELSQGPMNFTFQGPAATPVVTTPVVTSPVVTTPVVTTPATGSVVILGSGPDTLALQISEDAWQGDAQFTIAVNGVQIGGTQTATASHSVGASQTFDVMGSFSGPDTATITFLNDAYGGTPTTDRNLYETGATIDGNVVSGAALTELSGGAMSFLFQGPAATTTTPTTTSSPSSGNVVLNLAEDAYKGDAQFIVSIDGQPASAPQTVAALNSQGASEAFSLGTLSAGAHDIAVSFINDLYAGTPSTDRNLYVTGITVNGTASPNSTAAIMGDWTTHFAVNVPS